MHIEGRTAGSESQKQLGQSSKTGDRLSRSFQHGRPATNSSWQNLFPYVIYNLLIGIGIRPGTGRPGRVDKTQQRLQAGEERNTATPT